MAATTREAWSDSDSLERDLEEGGSGRHHPTTDEEVAQKPKVKVIQGEIEMTVLEWSRFSRCSRKDRLNCPMGRT